MAAATAPDLEAQPSFARMFDMCVWTVCSLRTSRSAITRSPRPSATKRSTSHSRVVGRGAPPGRSAASSRASKRCVAGCPDAPERRRSRTRLSRGVECPAEAVKRTGELAPGARRLERRAAAEERPHRVLERRHASPRPRRKSTPRAPGAVGYAASVTATSLFDTPQVRTYEWQRSYTADEYVSMRRTHSDTLMLSAEELDGLLAALTETIDRAGGEFTLRYRTDLVLARPRV